MNATVNPTRDRSGHTWFWALAVVFAVWGITAIARLGLDARPGLRAHFFDSTDWTGEPARSFVSSTIDTASLSRGWGFLPPDTFSARWSGYVFADRSGPYTFSTTSDDGSTLSIDGHLVVDNAGVHGPVTRSGSVELERGPHAVVIDYANAGGGYDMHWAWGHGTEPPSAVPGWLLSSKPRSFLTLTFVRVLDWLWPLCSLAAMIVAIGFIAARGWWPAHDDRPLRIVLVRRRAAICLAVFAAAAVLQTWPLATNPAHLSRNDNSDTMLNEWAIAWVAHELPRSPLHLFEANIFYPEPHTLALSEPLIVQGILAAPLLWAGASPTLAYNLVLLAGFALTGWAMCLVVWQWTDDWIAGIAAGLMLAFNAHTLTRMPHLQAQHAEFLPPALLALDALLRRPRWRVAVLLAVSVVAQALASLYLLIFTAIALAAATLARPEDWANARIRSVAPKIAVAAALTALALTPLLLPYWQLKSAGVTRVIDEAQFFAASWRDYATTQMRWHPMTGGGSALFPGIVPTALALVALASGAAFRDARARMCLAFGIAGVVLSFGPAVAPSYEFFFNSVPLLQAIRTSSRFGYLGLVAISVLGGYGLHIVRRSLGHGPGAVAGSIAIVVLVFLDPLAAPLSLTAFDGVPSIYRIPAADPRAVVAELPLAPPERQFRDAAADLHSTANWRPLVNGYSGFTPPGYVQRYLAMKGFPAPPAIAALRRAGVTHLFVHTDQFDARALDEIRSNTGLRQLAADGSVVLYALTGAPDYR